MSAASWPTIGCASERFKDAHIDLKSFRFNALEYSSDDLVVVVAQIFIEVS